MKVPEKAKKPAAWIGVAATALILLSQIFRATGCEKGSELIAPLLGAVTTQTVAEPVEEDEAPEDEAPENGEPSE